MALLSRKSSGVFALAVSLIVVGAVVANRFFGVALPPLIESSGAIACALLAAVVTLERFGVARSADIANSTPSVEERDKVEKDLDTRDASNDVEGALFILEQSKASYDAVVTTNNAIETKASSLLTMIAGAAGLLSLFGGFKEGAAQPAVSPFLWLAILAAVFSVLCCLYLLRTKNRPFPSAAVYVNTRTVWDNNSRFYISLELAEAYNSDIVFLRRDRRFEAPAYFAAQVFIGLAALALLTHFALPSKGKIVERTLDCKSISLPNSNASTISCVEHGEP